MVPAFRKILTDQTESPHLLSCILDAIEYGPPLPSLGEDLIRIVRDNARQEGTRVSALDAYQHVCPNNTEALRALLYDINEGRVTDEHHRLRGKLLYALYPAIIEPHEIGRYLVRAMDHHVNAYTMFVARELVHRTSPSELPLLFSGLDSTSIAGSPHSHIWEDFSGRLILKMLQHLGESASSPQVYEWLGKALDEHEDPVADREETMAIQTWLRSHPAVVQGLFRHWLSVTPFDKPWIEVIYFWKRLHNIVPPHGFHRWLLTLAELEPDPARAEFLFREAVKGSTGTFRDDAPTVEDLYEFAERNPRFKVPLETELCWNIDSWRRDDAKRRKKQEEKDETQRKIRVKQLSEHLETIRAGGPTQPLANLGRVYFGLFYDVDRDAAPRDRLAAFTTPEIAATALDGFVATLQRSDIPSPTMIAELEIEGKEYNIGFPILAGLDVLASKSFADVLLLPKSTLQSSLAFHYAITTEREREWVFPLIESLPNLAAEALMDYWRPHLAHNSRHIMGLYDLVHEDVMKPVAKCVSLTLLKDHPNSQEDNLELLLHSAIRNGDRPELLSLTQHVLTHHTSLTDQNRALWYAVAFALGHDSVKGGLAEHINGKSEAAARALSFLCPSRGIKSDTPYPLSVAGFIAIIAMMGPIFHPRNLSGVGWLSIRGPEEGASLVRSLIHRLGKELTHDASIALTELQEHPELTAWRLEIAHVLSDHVRQRREHAFKYPSVDQIIETLKHGQPANAADLQALVYSHLLAISAELRDGPTDGWKGMWNVDTHGKATEPRPEDNCRDWVLELLRQRLLPIKVAAEREGQYAEHKRADIKAIIGSINLPVEIKRHFHPDVWTAPRDQLKKLYARDPGTAGRGIYLVFWFGIGAGSVPMRATEGAEIHTPAQLEAALLEALQPSERESLEIIVIDCAPPQSPSARPAVRKLKKRKRS